MATGLKIVVTGGRGFLGIEVVKRLLARGTAWSPVAKAMVPIAQVAVFDAAPADALPAALAADARVANVVGSATEPGWAARLVDTPDVGVFHFASMMSGNSEADFDAAWAVNVLAQRDLLEALRRVGSTPRFFFTSSTASLGAEASGECATDLTKLVPEGTYGFTKAVCELMLNEYSRRHFVDGRGLRLPVVAVRPGAPNAAATGAYSNAVREPLAGKAGSVVLPPDLKMPVTSYQLAADNMIALMDVEQERLGIDRMYMQPSLSTDCAQLHAAARQLAAERRLPCGGLDVNVDPVATRIVGGMARATDGARARALGLRGDESAASIVQLYARDNLPPAYR
ncbi:hypothetical protein KFE25_004127 [Diacronema lutheri]|uniref:NAD-dependent epimerase/dehydratase domain-containing protein n=2 Tax=Diacronema lutheri TaxID=2081491 RepID=A0A8J6C3K1_DIALT|nr:hypothetical protein KFE25_004127 [Diacronema lutheri]